MNNDTERNSDAEIVERLERLKSRMAPDISGNSLVASAKRYNPYRIGAALAIVILSGGAIWVAYSAISQVDDNVAPPIIRADTSPTKVEPDDPGGLDVADQDMLIFDRLRNGQVEYEEQLLPPPEEPIDIRGNSSPNTTEEAAEIAITPEPTSEADVTENEPVQVVEETTVPDLPPPPAVILPAAETGAAYSVQLAALGSYDAAEAAWDTYVLGLPGLLARQTHHVALLERPGLPTLYRLRTGGFSGRQDADLFCDALKRQGQECMVVVR